MSVQFRNLAAPQDWRNVQGYPKSFGYFDASITFRPYSPTGNMTNEALNGDLRSETTGYRAVISLRWNHSFDNDDIRALLNLMTIGTARQVWSDQLGAYDPDEGVLATGPATNDYFNGQPAIVQGEPTVITDYVGGTRTATWAPPVGDNSDLTIRVLTATNQRLRLLFYPDATESDNFEVTIDDAQFRVIIEATISRQPIDIELRSTNIFTQIPAYVVSA
jgi:hypothetical protein